MPSSLRAALEQQDRELGGGRLGPPLSAASALISRARSSDVAQQPGDLVHARCVEPQRRAQDEAAGMVEAAVVGRRGHVGEDLLEVLAEDAAAGGARELRPVALAEPDGRDRPVEVLERAAARFGADEFDRAEVAQQADVVADAPERQAELAGQLVRARRCARRACRAAGGEAGERSLAGALRRVRPRLAPIGYRAQPWRSFVRDATYAVSGRLSSCCHSAARRVKRPGSLPRGRPHRLRSSTVEPFGCSSVPRRSRHGPG